MDDGSIDVKASAGIVGITRLTNQLFKNAKQNTGYTFKANTAAVTQECNFLQTTEILRCYIYTGVLRINFSEPL